MQDEKNEKKSPECRPEADAAALRARLAKAGKGGGAAGSNARRQSPFEFYGVGEDTVRRLARKAAKPYRTSEAVGPLLEMAQQLWKGEKHEDKSAAVFVLSGMERFLEAEHWDVFKAWIEEVRSADHCDAVAVSLVGALVMDDHAWVRVLRHWARSESPWVRRASALGVLSRARQMSDIEAALSVCELLMSDSDELVQEGVGSLLKECLEIDSAWTLDFLNRWRNRTPSTVLHIVARDSEPDQRREILGA